MLMKHSEVLIRKKTKEQLKMDTILINEKKINKIFLLCVYRLYYFSFN